MLRLFILFLLACSLRAAEPLVLAHYMPWYAARDGRWGWHWTMEKFQPDKVRWDGRREIASHDYPLIGPYDSGDAHTLECQVLLMKFAGLDGVIVDWYGTRDFHDYAANHRHTEALIPWLKRAGLRFAVCYEDQSAGHMAKGGALRAEDALAYGKETLRWLAERWFGDDAYVQEDGKPVLLVFGPQYFKADDWRAMREGLPVQPLVFGLPHLAKDAGLDGAYAWPPVAGGKTLAPAEWHAKLALLDARRAAGERVIPVVFPGFSDIYRQAGVHDSYGQIAHRNGATFAESLDLALKSHAPLVQVATWNDYGEGTVIEPTRNHGYRHLEKLQRARPARGFTAADLRLPVMLHQLRSRSAGDAEITDALDGAATSLFDGKCRDAESALDAVRDTLAQRPAVFHDATEPACRLASDILYRDGALTDAMRLRCRLDVYHPVERGFATVVWLHGGGLTAGSRFIPQPLRQKGVAVVTADYRLGPEHASPAYLEDAAAVIAWTLDHIARYGGDPARVFVSGHSAGAYLIAMATLDRRWLAPHGLDPSRIAGAIPLSAQMITHFVIRGERGIGEKQPAVDDLAPLFHVRADAPPMLIVTGDREKELHGRYEENAYFWRMMKVAGHKDSALLEMKGADHAGMPEPAFPALLDFVANPRATRR